MNQIQSYLTYGWGFLIISIVLLVAGCARQINPEGGPKDSVGPKLVKVFPNNQSLHFEEDEIVFTFDEFIRTASFGKEIFMSPLPSAKGKPKVLVTNKKLRIKFQEPFLPNTTYLLTLSDIADVNASNKMERPFTYAFSTGGVIDSMEIRGRVLNPLMGVGQSNVTILLFEADSISGNDFLGKRPTYVSKSDANGRFELKYLGNRPYKILGVEDSDQSYSYNLPTEPLAISTTNPLVFEDTTLISKVYLWAFLPDEQPPLLKRTSWLNDQTLVCEFIENIREDSLKILYKTASNTDSSLRKFSYVFPNDELGVLLLDIPIDSDSTFQLQFEGLQDSLGNRKDTLITLTKGGRKYEHKDSTFFVSPAVQYNPLRVEFYTTSIWDSIQLAKVSFLDSTTRPVKPLIKQNGFHISFSLEIPQPLTSLYKLYYKEPDTTLTYPLKWPNTEECGTLSGFVIRDSSYKGGYIVHLQDAKGKIVRTTYEENFSFQFLSPGKYRFQVVADLDKNKCWSPGSLVTNRLPEQIFQVKTSPEIKANWDIEAFEISIPNLDLEAEKTTGGEASSEEGGGTSGRRKGDK